MRPRRIGRRILSTAGLEATLAWGMTVTLALVLPQPALAQADLIITEIDYDQPGQPDTMEWIELHNPADAEVQTHNIALVLYKDDQQGNCVEYCRIDLSPLQIVAEAAYVVIGVHPCANPLAHLCAPADAIQNGTGGAVVVEEYGQVTDSVEYGTILANAACNFTRTSVSDRESVGGSIQRCGDTWIFSSTSTPCAPNNCTTTDVPSVPTLWGSVKSFYR